ncbi:deoxyribodipyrimidine photolyase [Galbibacter orientalis DSM 19592]|uniref:Deoxyribodipyrimidine photolyase n=1 Tax=Galbibacter orientalis DSM 19592 TaxID=926559 RepID=I3CA19_9FLAO|nr:deoxyribodipyrimidine photo-lyase [Galbibacter orientalis]EIJ40462.1 deoxyribodipyrimidine photolyase [Galbibacter orientalis DSM 19592]
MKKCISIFWFRRDLRLNDNIGFLEALKSGNPVMPIFIFDSNILQELPKNDARVTFIHGRLQEMRMEFQERYDSSIALYFDTPINVFKSLVKEYEIQAIYTNRDYEPYAKERDQEISTYVSSKKIEFKTFKDQVVFEKDEVVKDDGDPYVVYTPYMKKWKENFSKKNATSVSLSEYFDKLVKNTRLPQLSLSDIGFNKSSIEVKNYDITPSILDNYKNLRDFPAQKGTSNISVHLRFGTISIRQAMQKALEAKEHTFWNELIWREFFMQILWHFPETTHNAFRKKYDKINWRNNETEFQKWCKGETGYPLVDAGMRQLNKTGYMHNRVRMVVASFLCKHLLIDWRWGEAYFAERLLDYELSSNVGNWQWAAGSGVDAAPYFRIFNPTTQIKKFDKDLKYINTWVEDLNELTYPDPIVDHKEARERCLKTYKEALS